ncbi:glycosyltransferase [Porifericola rhodea]|uniref:glycosyltransferase family 2 protein n=1 Tax=Porifericola rhodea TaxID=930972 RepID=UPI0026663CF6|nr:glycosyltransferase family 2 protein [Porifericola rhodea]WKN29785.1 glycosyltransferase [Porifericola rhodea]
MTISVIIPTYNGAHKILRTLRALERQSMQEFETIVVVDGSTDNTLNLLNESSLKLKKITIIAQENQGRAAVRNRGGDAATGKLLVFLDDDMRPHKQWLEAHLYHHQKYQNTIGVGSQLNDWSEAYTEMQRYRCYYSRRWEKHFNNQKNEPTQLDQDTLHITAANFSISQNIFRSLHGFEEQLRDAEDYDLAVRAFERNIPVFFLPNAKAWHDENYTLASYIRRRKGYLKAHQSLIQLRPELYAKHTLRNVTKKKGLKKIVFWLFSSSYWVKAVDTANLFRWVPAPLRFRLYDLIITSKVVYFPR